MRVINIQSRTAHCNILVSHLILKLWYYFTRNTVRFGSHQLNTTDHISPGCLLTHHQSGFLMTGDFPVCTRLVFLHRCSSKVWRLGFRLQFNQEQQLVCESMPELASCTNHMGPKTYGIGTGTAIGSSQASVNTQTFPKMKTIKGLWWCYRCWIATCCKIWIKLCI